MSALRERATTVLTWPARAWEGFWFDLEDDSTLSVLRSLFGLLVLCWSLTLLPDLMTFYSESGVMPEPWYGSHRLGIFQWLESDAAIVVTYVALLLGAGKEIESPVRSRLILHPVVAVAVDLQDEGRPRGGNGEGDGDRRPGANGLSRLGNYIGHGSCIDHGVGDVLGLGGNLAGARTVDHDADFYSVGLLGLGNSMEGPVVAAGLHVVQPVEYAAPAQLDGPVVGT